MDKNIERSKSYVNNVRDGKRRKRIKLSFFFFFYAGKPQKETERLMLYACFIDRRKRYHVLAAGSRTQSTSNLNTPKWRTVADNFDFFKRLLLSLEIHIAVLKPSFAETKDVQV